MELGSAEHKALFIKDKLKIHHENIWTIEIRLLHARKELADRKAYLHLIPGQMERKEYPSANDGRKDQKQTEGAIKTLESQVFELDAEIRNQELAIEKTQQWAEGNGKA